MMTQKKFMRRCVMASIFYALISGLVTFGALETVLPSSSLGFFVLWGYLGLNFVFLIWLFKRFSVTRVRKVWLVFVPLLMVQIAPLVLPVTLPYMEFMRDVVFQDFPYRVESGTLFSNLETIKYAFLFTFIPSLIHQIPSLLVLYLVSLKPNFPDNGESVVLRIMRKMVITSDRNVSNTAAGQISLA